MLCRAGRLGVHTDAAIWLLLADGATRAQLVEAILERFDVERTLAGDDVQAFLDELRARDLVELS